MKTLPRPTATLTIAAMGLVSACASGVLVAADKPPNAISAAPGAATGPMPDIGTRMPDGTVYAGLSMITGKPSFIEAAGGRMPDGTIYAGISPDTGKPLYTTAADAPEVYTWDAAMQYCRTLAASGHSDWRVPSMGELAMQFGNRAEIGGFNESGRMEHATGYYWSSLPVSDQEAWAQRFNDGFHEHPGKDIPSSVRCVR
jgi:hypothetical protein